MKEEKLEQLRKVFKSMVKEIIKDVGNIFDSERGTAVETYSECISRKLVYEVKIRINNKN